MKNFPPQFKLEVYIYLVEQIFLMFLIITILKESKVKIKIYFSEYSFYKILPLSSFEQRIFGQTFLLSLQRPANTQAMKQFKIYNYQWNQYNMFKM